MVADGVCGLLFCAAKRSGAFPPNMAAGLRVEGRSPGNFFPNNNYNNNNNNNNNIIIIIIIIIII
jgi:hypothetical protein